jgi:hypothetical protein
LNYEICICEQEERRECEAVVGKGSEEDLVLSVVKILMPGPLSIYKFHKKDLVSW